MGMLDTLLGLMRVLHNGMEVSTSRRTLNFKGSGVDVQDNEALDCFDITIGGGGGGGSVLDGVTFDLDGADEGDVLSFVGGQVVPVANTGGTDTTLDGVTANLTGAANGQVLGIAGGQIVPVAPPGGTFAGYQGHSNANWTWNSFTWAALFSAITSGSMINDISVGVSRSGSVFTFAKAGYYRVSVDMRSYNTSNAMFLALRLRKGSTTLLQMTGYAPTNATNTPASLNGIILVGAGDSVTLQYMTPANSGFPGAFSSSDPFTIDGEAMVTCNVGINFVGS